MNLAPISNEDALRYFERYSQYRGPFSFAICARDADTVHGVIALVADGATFALGHIWTDGNAHVGSLLYGAAWRTAKAMGYSEVRI